MLFSATILTKPLCVSPLHCYTRFRVPTCPGQGWLATVTFYGFPIFFRGMLFSATILTKPLCVSPLHCYTRFRVPTSPGQGWLATVKFYGYPNFFGAMLFSATILTKPLCVSLLHCYTRFSIPPCPGQKWLATLIFYTHPIFFWGGGYFDGYPIWGRQWLHSQHCKVHWKFTCICFFLLMQAYLGIVQMVIVHIL